MVSLTTDANVGIAVATATVVAFLAGALAGFLAGVLVFYCINKHRSQSFKPESSPHQQEQIISSSKPLRKTEPEYEEVIELRQNTAYEPAETGIDTRANEAYQD